MKLTTKERIINSALSLLNEQGIKNTRLQHIADHVGISVGNLAYHFSDFKQLFRSIEIKTLGRLNTISNHWDSSDYFIDFDNKLAQYFHLMLNFKYYYIDSIEIKRTYPKAYKNRIDYSVRFKNSLERLLIRKAEDHFLEFVDKTAINHLTHNIWTTSSLWLIRNELEDNLKLVDLEYRKAIWNQIFPYFSENGKIEYEIIILPKLE